MLEKKINEDLKKAMKEKNEIKTSIIRMIRSSIHNFKIEKKKEKLSDEEIVDILQKHRKRAKESLEGFKKGNREDLVKKEEAELAIINAYLPKPLSDEELKKIVTEAIKETGAASKSDMGRLMKEIMPKVKGRADGKKVNQMVQACLQG